MTFKIFVRKSNLKKCVQYQRLKFWIRLVKKGIWKISLFNEIFEQWTSITGAGSFWFFLFNKVTKISDVNLHQLTFNKAVKNKKNKNNGRKVFYVLYTQ